MNRIEPANIEDLKWTVISPDVKFDSGFGDIAAITYFRKQNLKTTNMFWITKQPVIDCAYNVYNPKALIMVILN